MAVNLDGPGGLFTRLGRIFGAIDLVNRQRGGEVGVAVDEIVEDFAGDEAMIDSIYASLASHRSSAGSLIGPLRTLAATTLVEMVDEDNPRPDTSVRTALIELVRQMEAASESVDASSVAASVSAASGNVGDATVAVTTRLASGRVCERALAESISAEVTADGQPGGGALAGRERLSVRGERAVDALSWEWPNGSGANATLALVDASDDALGGAANWVRNGDFADWTAGIPSGWSVTTGTAGVHFLEESSSGFDEATALAIVGNGSTNTTLHQQFGTSLGSTVAFQPLQQVGVCIRARVSPAPAAGVLRVALVDGTNAVVSDDEGNANAFNVDLTTLGSTYVARTGFFRTPTVLPATLRLQLRLTTPLSAASTLLVDEVTMAQPVQLYQGGPGVVVFSGRTPAIRGDRWTITVTNSDHANFQAWFDRVLGSRSLGILLPSSGSPTIPDTLISSESSGA